MEADEAIELVSLMQAAYPGRDFTGRTGALFSEALMAYEIEDGQAAVSYLIGSSIYPPALAEIHEECRSRRRERLEKEIDERRLRSLSEWSEFMQMGPEAVREALAPYWEKFGGRDSQELRVAVERGDREAKIEAGRRLALAMEQEEIEREGQAEPVKTYDHTLERTSCGVLVGTPMNWDARRGEFICPSCGNPRSLGCGGSTLYPGVTQGTS